MKPHLNDYAMLCLRRTPKCFYANFGWLHESCAREPRTSTATAPGRETSTTTTTTSSTAQADPTTRPMPRDDYAGDCLGRGYVGASGGDAEGRGATATHEGRARRALYLRYLPQLGIAGVEKPFAVFGYQVRVRVWVRSGRRRG